MRHLFTPLAALVLVVFCGLGSGHAGSTFISIGTGGITGVYYPTGGAIAKMLNKKKKEYGIRATVESTGGSVFNINALMTGNFEFGIVQSDRQFQAVNGLADWKEKGPQTDLRAVFSLYMEPVTLVAASDAGIKNITDLRGKKVNIGNPGSGHRQNAIDALHSAGLDYQKDIQAFSYKASEAAGLLQDRRIDAFFYTVGNPSSALKEATSGVRKVVIAAITDVDSLLATYPYYQKTIVPMRFYPGALNKKDVQTFGVKATLVTSAKVPDSVVYALTKEVFENLQEFKTLHPAFANLTKEGMISGLSAPIHPGAMKYYKEEHLIK